MRRKISPKKTKLNFKNVIWLIVFLVFTAKIIGYLVNNQSFFSRPYDYEYMAKTYSESQYVIGQLSKGGIGDDGVYSFAGVYYLSGGDPAQVNFEHPPLGKYLIGLSITIFHNENIINLIYFVFFLTIVYLLARQVFADARWSSLAAVFVASDSLILDQLIRSQLDLPFMLFFLGGVYFFIVGTKQFRFLYLSAIFWGMAASTKFFPAYLFVALFLVAMVFWYDKKLLKHFIISQLIVITIYFASHAMYFYHHPSLIEFLRFRKWTVAWWSGSPILIGNVIRSLFTGYYIDSVGQLTKNASWSVVWPIAFILTTFSIRVRYFVEKNLIVVLYWGFSVMYLFYVSFFTGGLQKFLLPVWPFAVYLAFRQLRVLIKSSSKKLSI